MKTIYIIGYGAIGKALAVFLKLNGKKVVVLRGSVDEQPDYTEKIRVILKDKEFVSELEISSLSNHATLKGIVVLTNKSFGNKSLALALRNKAGNSPIVLLQNGLGVEQPFIESNFSEIYRCVLLVTSQSVDQTSINFKPVTRCPVGVVRGSKDRLCDIAEQLSSPQFQFEAETNIERVIWKKVIINCVFNSICPLLEIDNGVFHRNESALAIAKRIIKECLEICNENGIPLTYEEIEESLLLISKSSDGQFISTLQDINNKKETEIETLNFAIASLAKKTGRAGKVKETTLLGELVKLKSSLHL